MPIVNIQVIEGRSEEKIKKLIEDVTSTVTTSFEVPEQSVRVLVQEVKPTHWGIAGVPKSDLHKKEV